MVADRAACHNRKDKANDVRSDGYHEYDAAHTMIVGTDQAAFARGEATGVLFEASWEPLDAGRRQAWTKGWAIILPFAIGELGLAIAPIN